MGGNTKRKRSRKLRFLNEKWDLIATKALLTTKQPGTLYNNADKTLALMNIVPSPVARRRLFEALERAGIKADPYNYPYGTPGRWINCHEMYKQAAARIWPPGPPHVIVGVDMADGIEARVVAHTKKGDLWILDESASMSGASPSGSDASTSHGASSSSCTDLSLLPGSSAPPQK